MKTSTTQFEMLVNFMEEHGDLNKPTSTKSAHGRIQAIRLWERLTNLLNSDSSGTSKSTDKWKKAWSDLKNNTKKKAAKISKAARGTGGGPALQLKLSELEQRILNILGPQAVSGLAAITEAGFTQTQNLYTAQQQQNDSNRTLTLTPVANGTIDESPSILNFIDYQNPIELLTMSMTLQEPQDTVSLPMELPIDFFNVGSPAPSYSHQDSPPPRPPPHAEPAPPLSPVVIVAEPAPPLSPVVIVAEPAPPLSPVVLVASPPPPGPEAEAQTPPARARVRARARDGRIAAARRDGRVLMLTPRRIGLPRRSRPPTNVERAAQQFVDSDEQWRNFLRQQHTENLEVQRHKIRVEERWQNIAEQAIAALNRILDSRL